MKKLGLCLFLLFITGLVQAKPRNPFPKTPDEVGQNDRDLDDAINQAREDLTITSTTLPTGSTNYIQNRNTLQSGATAYPDKLRVGVSGNNPVFEVLGTTMSVYRPTQFDSTIRLGTGNSYLLGDPNNGFRFNNSADTINILIANNNGEVTQPNQPSFLVNDGTGGSNVTGDATTYTQLWPTELYDQGGDFASNTFTAPINGRYFLQASVQATDITSSHTSRIWTIVTSNRSYAMTQNPTSQANSNETWTMSVIADMDAGDTATITIRVSGSTKTVSVVGSSNVNYFSGSLIN